MSESNKQRLIVTPDYLVPNVTDILDARSPSEFQLDHIPGAINWPVLDDEQRAEVGTLYTKDSFAAKKLGAQYVTENISNGIEKYLADKEPNFCPLVYCWRGGQRSLSLATILSQIGWRCYLLDGGYKSYRAGVRDLLAQQVPKYSLIVVSGLTGTAKTKILKHLTELGEQVIDLEDLAKHRGSLLGAEPSIPQPSQKLFESALAEAFRQLDPNKVVWIESESNKIGNLQVPIALWKLMRSTRQVVISAPLRARTDYILKEYKELTETPAILNKKLSYLSHRISKEIFSGWMNDIESGDWSSLVQSLLEDHYDPSYQRSLRNNKRQTIHSIDLNSCSQNHCLKAAKALCKIT